MGGADAVQKTTSLGDAHGTDATGSASSGGVTAPVASRGGLGVLGWGVLVVAALLLVAYAAGLFT